MNMTTAHWDAAYNAVSQHPVLGKNTRCAVWIETIGEAVLAVGEQPQPDRKHDVKRLRCYSYAVSLAELALAGNEQAAKAFKAVSPLLYNPSVTKKRILDAAFAASGGEFGRHRTPYADAGISRVTHAVEVVP